jgi:hypothetical protein
MFHSFQMHECVDKEKCDHIRGCSVEISRLFFRFEGNYENLSRFVSKLEREHIGHIILAAMLHIELLRFGVAYKDERKVVIGAENGIFHIDKRQAGELAFGFLCEREITVWHRLSPFVSRKVRIYLAELDLFCVYFTALDRCKRLHLSLIVRLSSFVIADASDAGEYTRTLDALGKAPQKAQWVFRSVS